MIHQTQLISYTDKNTNFKNLKGWVKQIVKEEVKHNWD